MINDFYRSGKSISGSHWINFSFSRCQSSSAYWYNLFLYNFIQSLTSFIRRRKSFFCWRRSRGNFIRFPFFIVLLLFLFICYLQLSYFLPQFLMARTKSDAQFNSEEMRRFYQRFLDVRKLPVPVISAINGPAIGAGYFLFSHFHSFVIIILWTAQVYNK